MSAVATETICFGETSMSWTSAGRHVGDLGGGAEEDVALELQLEVLERGGLRRAPHEDALLGEGAVVVERRVGLGDDVLLFLVGGEVDDLVGDLAVRRPCGTATR